MHHAQDPEKRALLEKPTIRVRRAAPSDALAVVNIAKHHIQHAVDATLVAAPPVSEVEAAIKNASKSPNLIYLVADSHMDAHSPLSESTATTITHVLSKEVQAALPNGILGYAMVNPYKSPATRTGYERTGSMNVATLGESVLGAELESKVKAALLDDALSMCRADGCHYKTIISDMVSKDDLPVLKNSVDLFLQKGFRLAGTLKGILEKDGLLFDQVFLQITL
ncbi:hypothetical protein Hte_006259 [Hypoxylon texense]